MRRCVVLAVVAQLLLVAAGLRHNLIWGENERWPWLLPLLNLGQACCLVGFVVLAGFAWWRAMQLAAASALDVGRLYRLTVPILVAAILVPLTASMDPIDYVVRGRLLALHGGNPYVQMAADFPHDPFLQFGDAGWKTFPLPYGPVIAWLQAGVAWCAHGLPLPPRGELIAAIALFKLIFAAALFSSAHLLRRLAVASGQGSRASAVFLGVAWNPVLLFEGVANAHNDPLVMLCVAAAAMAAAAGKHGRAALAVGVGTLAKAVPILLAPLWAAFAIRQGQVRAMLGGALATLAIAGIAWWQFFRVPGAFDVAHRQAQLGGPGLHEALSLLTGLSVPDLLQIGRAVVVAWLSWMTVCVWRQPTLERLVFAAASTMFAMAACGNTLSGPWYHAWWVPLALLHGRGWLTRLACAVSILAPLAYLGWFWWRDYDAATNWIRATFFLFAPLVVASVPWSRPRQTAA